MIVVAGPRIDPRGAAGRPTASRCAPYVHDLLPAPGGVRPRRRAGRPDDVDGADRQPAPFLYFPLRHHFEQNFHVRHRLERYGAGRRMDFDTDAPGGDRRGDRRGDRPRGRLPAGRPDGAARAAA